MKSDQKNGKLICFFVKNEMVYRAWRTFLQAAVGVLVAGLFEYLAGRFTGQSPQKVIPYFIATAVAAGISAVMNRSGKKDGENSGDGQEPILEEAAKITEALFPPEASELPEDAGDNKTGEGSDKKEEGKEQDKDKDKDKEKEKEGEDDRGEA